MNGVAGAVLLACCYFGSRPLVAFGRSCQDQAQFRHASIGESGFTFLIENVSVSDDAEKIGRKPTIDPCRSVRRAHGLIGFKFDGERAYGLIWRHEHAISALNPVPDPCVVYPAPHSSSGPTKFVLEFSDPCGRPSVVNESEVESVYCSRLRDLDKQPWPFYPHQGIRAHLRCLRANVCSISGSPRFMERILHRPPLPLHDVRLVGHRSNALFCRFCVCFRGQSISRCDMCLPHGDLQAPAHMSRLAAHRYELQNGDDYEASREAGNPPIGRRFLSGLISGVACYLLCDSDLWRRGRR